MTWSNCSSVRTAVSATTPIPRVHEVFDVVRNPWPAARRNWRAHVRGEDLLSSTDSCPVPLLSGGEDRVNLVAIQSVVVPEEPVAELPIVPFPRSDHELRASLVDHGGALELVAVTPPDHRLVPAQEHADFAVMAEAVIPYKSHRDAFRAPEHRDLLAWATEPSYRLPAEVKLCRPCSPADPVHRDG